MGTKGLTIILILSLIYSPVFAAVYLDGSTTGCINGSTNYRPASRDCGFGGTDTVYLDLANFSSNIPAQTTSYIRSGNYYRNTGSHIVGSLNLSAAGTSGAHTIVRAYPGEERQVVIYTGAGLNQYNPNPSDTSTPGCTPGSSVGGSACYYPCSAVLFGAEYIDLYGIKTFGQVHIAASNVSIQDSDIGGGGPYYNQGQAIMITGPTSLALTGVLIKNNKIHHSAWGESGQNGATLMMYAISGLVVDQCTFEDGYGSDIRLKDTRYSAGTGSIEIKNSLFKQSTLNAGNTGIESIGQYGQVALITFHNNIFISKGSGIDTKGPPDSVVPSAALHYNNTFINCTNDYKDSSALTAYSSFNNLFYHNTGSGLYYYGTQSTPNANIAADYNVYYSSSVTPSFRSSTCNTTSLATWASCSGHDAASISQNPQFANLTNCLAYDATGCKRLSYIENFTGSSYGVNAGAYETGSEQIGVNWSGGVVITDASVTFASYGGTGGNGNPSSSVLFYANPQITGAGVSGTQGMGNIMGIPAGEAATFVNIIMN